ncbi:unnamed protein product, partial [Orchesella dallaii]
MENFNTRNTEYDIPSGNFGWEIESIFSFIPTNEEMIKHDVFTNRKHWGIMPMSSFEWQKSQLESVRESGIPCLRNMWMPYKAHTVE